MSAEPYYSPEKVAEMLSFTPGVIRAKLRSGKLRGSKVFGEWRVPQSAIDELLHSGTRQGESTPREVAQAENARLGSTSEEL